MIYVDTSVVLAQLFSEDRVPPAALWHESLVSSRLTVYETWTRTNARRLGATYAEAVQALLGRLALIELTPAALARALEPFPVAVRTLDALHLASLDFLRAQALPISLASYDERLCLAARRMKIPLYRLP